MYGYTSLKCMDVYCIAPKYYGLIQLNGLDWIYPQINPSHYCHSLLPSKPFNQETQNSVLD